MKMGKMNLFCFFTLALVLVLSSSAFAKSKDVTALQIGVKFKPKTCDILLSMCVGEKRKLKIPAKLGYGAQGSPPTIPGGATVIFETELVAVNGKPSNAAAETTDVTMLKRVTCRHI
ncbi:hypothetical protein MKW92_040099 [Papaver armeniacum]|nr:hypothetical protein MKW92_040099 [Papaver armeniacum]